MPIAFAGSWTCQNIQVPWEQNQSPKMTPGMRAAEPDTKQPFEGFRLGWCGACDRGEQERKPAFRARSLPTLSRSTTSEPPLALIDAAMPLSSSVDCLEPGLISS